MKVDCSQSLFFRKIAEIERFALRIAILDESQNYLGSGGVVFLTLIQDGWP